MGTVSSINHLSTTNQDKLFFHTKDMNSTDTASQEFVLRSGMSYGADSQESPGGFHSDTIDRTTGQIRIQSGEVSNWGGAGVCGDSTSGDVKIDTGTAVSLNGTAIQGKLKLGTGNDQGNTIEIGAGGSNDTIKLDGDITKIGKSTHTNGYYLKWDGNNSKAIWAAGGSGGSPAGSDEEIQYNNGGTMGSTDLIKITDTDEVELGGAAGTNAKFRLNSGSDLILEADTAGGSGGSSIGYLDSGSSDRMMLAVHSSNKVALCNRASNGTVEIRANDSNYGSSGEKTVATFKYDGITIRDNGETTSSTDTLRNVGGQLNFDGDIITRVKRVSLSVSEYQGLGTTSVELIAAPGGTNHIVIDNVLVKATSGSTGSETRMEDAYVGHVDGSTSQYFGYQKDFLRGMPTSSTYMRQFENNNGKISNTSTANRAVYLYSTGDFVGNISLEIAITYSVVRF